MSPHPGFHSLLRRIPILLASCSLAPGKKALTIGPNFVLSTGMGLRKPREGLGASIPRSGIFCGCLSHQPPPPPRSPSHQLLRRRLPPATPAHQSTLSCHARVASGAPRRCQIPGRRLAFPSPSIAERAPGPRTAGGPRRPQTSPSAPIPPSFHPRALRGVA